MPTYLTIAEAAERVKASRSLLQAKCKDGTIPSIRIGKAYRIADADLDAWVSFTPAIAIKQQTISRGDISEWLTRWTTHMAVVRALSKDTVRTHITIIRSYIKKLVLMGRRVESIQDLLSAESYLAFLVQEESRSFALKINTFSALVCFSTFLADSGAIAHDLRASLEPLKPSRQREPRRTNLKPNEVPALFELVMTGKRSQGDKLALAAILAMMLYAGLRSSEVCNLVPADVDLENREIRIRNGKGGKSRVVGINQSLLVYLNAYAKVRPRDAECYFVQQTGVRFNRNKLAQRMQKLSIRMRVDITCHGLRRTFATLASNRGRSINSIRIALGHSDLQTTQLYLRTREGDVVEDMKHW